VKHALVMSDRAAAHTTINAYLVQVASCQSHDLDDNSITTGEDCQHMRYIESKHSHA